MACIIVEQEQQIIHCTNTEGGTSNPGEKHYNKDRESRFDAGVVKETRPGQAGTAVKCR